jgi:hypothetical protein
MATIVIGGTDRITVDAANLAKHYGVQIAVCPPRRPQRKGVVEAAVKYTTKSWWRTAPVTTPAEAQASLESWSVQVADQRSRPDGTVGELGAAEPLLGLPALAYPALIRVERKASRSALVPFESNHYSVPPVFADRVVIVQTRVGEPDLQIISMAGVTIAVHRRARNGAKQTFRTSEHAKQLKDAVLAAFTTGHPCASKVNRPPGIEALAELDRLKGLEPDPGNLVSLADYQQLADAASKVAAR